MPKGGLDEAASRGRRAEGIAREKDREVNEFCHRRGRQLCDAVELPHDGIIGRVVPAPAAPGGVDA